MASATAVFTINNVVGEVTGEKFDDELVPAIRECAISYLHDDGPGQHAV